MSAQSRRFSLSILIAVCMLLLPGMLIAQDATDAPPIENSKFQATGAINANSVFLRSGAGDTDYPVLKLDKGSQITVVGKKFDWLKVVPPEGSFCYVAKAYIDRRGDGTVGRSTKELYVRVGSQLNGMKSKIAMKLESGRDVQIMGDENEYFKVKPPEGVFFYVNAQYVDVVKVMPPVKDPSDNGSSIARNDSRDNSHESKSNGDTNTQPKSDGNSDSGMPSNNPNDQIAMDTSNPTTGPSTQPSGHASADAESRFDKLEIAYADAIQKPLDQQDIPMLLAGYQQIARADAGLPETLRRIADAKCDVLKQRMKDREDYLAVRKTQEEMKTRQMALEAERQELEQRLKSSDMKYYAAVGVLRPSSLQQGKEMMYRLTDPANGRTVVYLRTNDDKIGALIGQFIGVKGDVATDSQLAMKVISPTLFETVDQSKLNTTVASQICPPSMMPGGGASATTGNE